MPSSEFAEGFGLGLTGSKGLVASCNVGAGLQKGVVLELNQA